MKSWLEKNAKENNEGKVVADEIFKIKTLNNKICKCMN